MFMFLGYWHVPAFSFHVFISVFGKHSLVSIIVKLFSSPEIHWSMWFSFYISTREQLLNSCHWMWQKFSQSKNLPYNASGYQERLEAACEGEAIHLRHWNHSYGGVRPWVVLDFLEQANKCAHTHARVHTRRRPVPFLEIRQTRYSH